MKSINSSSSSSGSKNKSSIKFVYSYGGKILPRRHSDAQLLLRYVGGHIRILSVDRFITISDLMMKFEDSCGFSVNLKCKLPNEDLDVLVSITSDEDLANIIEEYVRASSVSNKELKIRAILFPNLKSVNKKVHVHPLPPPPPVSSSCCSRVGSSSGSTIASVLSSSSLAIGFPFQRNIPCCFGEGNFARSNISIPPWSHHHHNNRFNLA
ncbi:uncharacterized protein LOC124944791 [Impatiens glandulifera]|uniref:uncharacterized protein LOC124944791 n=1 Tax=Impatiens glandulifera TaxID=253017 RepID=UPI001FB19AB8|nr:uncharacterized protein LOC124944791 [Impatiens glandulifera]